MEDVADQHLVMDPELEKYLGPGPTIGEYADVLENQARFWDLINECRKRWYGTDLSLGIFLGAPNTFFGNRSPIELLKGKESFMVIEHLEHRGYQ